MFQFGGFPSCNYGFITGSTVLHHRGFPIRRSTGQSLFPAHRGLSQVVASFIGSWCQGIHLMLFFAWTARLILSSLKLASIAWASQIIVFWVVNFIKRPFFFWIPLSFHPLFRVFGKIVLDPFGSPLLLERPSNLIIKKSLNTTICSFLSSLFGFQWTFVYLYLSVLVGPNSTTE